MPENVNLVLELENDLAKVNADPNQIRHAMLNLVVNAMEALDTVEIEDKQIVVKTYFADSVILEISDNGPGIDPQMRETIFEPFVSSKVDGENMGLGLAIVKSILSSYLGTIQLTADGAEGVKFRIELPLNRAESEGEN